MINYTEVDWSVTWREEGRTEGRAEGRAKGRIEGRAEGGAEVVRRMAARKFGAETAQPLAGRLATITDPERVGEIGEWLLVCEDDDELLERVERLCGTGADRSPPAMNPREDTYTLLFSKLEMMRDLLAGFVPGELIQDLDLSTLEPWPEGCASDDFGRHRHDRMWRVRQRGHWLYVPLLLEHQSTGSRSMAVRILACNALLYGHLLRAAPSDPLPPVLPIVIYYGAERWTAPEEEAGLTPFGEHLAPYQPWQRYFVLDIGGYPGPLPEGRNLVGKLIRLERSRHPTEDPAELGTMFRALAERVPGPEGITRAFWDLMGQMFLPARCTGAELPPLRNWREAGTELREILERWEARWRERGRTDGSAGKADRARRSNIASSAFSSTITDRKKSTWWDSSVTKTISIVAPATVTGTCPRGTPPRGSGRTAT